MTILPWVMPIVVALLVLAMALAAWRVIVGPDAVDRVLALDTLYIDALLLVMALGVWRNTTQTFEVALLIGLLGFLGSVAVAGFLLRGRIVP